MLQLCSAFHFLTAYYFEWPASPPCLLCSASCLFCPSKSSLFTNLHPILSFLLVLPLQLPTSSSPRLCFWASDTSWKIYCSRWFLSLMTYVLNFTFYTPATLFPSYIIILHIWNLTHPSSKLCPWVISFLEGPLNLILIFCFYLSYELPLQYFFNR